MSKVNNGQPWTKGDIRHLRAAAKRGSVKAAAKSLGRTAPAVQQKAMREGIRFR